MIAFSCRFARLWLDLGAVGGMYVQNQIPAPEELASIMELAEEFNMGESTVWLLVKRHDLDRFRIPGRGKTTYVNRQDFDRARQTPIPIRADAKKAAA